MLSSVVLETIHGSHLYGLAHENSDRDVYRVQIGVKPRQTIVGDNDTMLVSLTDFSAAVVKGVPQALEALFSPYKTVQGPYTAYVLGLQPGLAATRATYLRTIKSFWLFDDLKRKTHAVRLIFNLDEFVRTGRFNPNLTSNSVKVARQWAENKDWSFISNAAQQAALGQLDYKIGD